MYVRAVSPQLLRIDLISIPVAASLVKLYISVFVEHCRVPL